MTPKSWDNGQHRWVPCHKGLSKPLGSLSVFSGGGPPYDPGGGPPGFPGRGPLAPLGGCPSGPLASKEEVPLVEAPGPPGTYSGGPQIHLALQEVVLRAHHSCGKAVLH